MLHLWNNNKSRDNAFFGLILFSIISSDFHLPVQLKLLFIQNSLSLFLFNIKQKCKQSFSV